MQKEFQRLNIFIDASSIVDGGGFTHLNQLLKEISEINNHLFLINVIASESVLNLLPNSVNIEKISHKNLNKGIISRLFFQLIQMDKLLIKKCDILFNLTGDYIGSFKPYISMSQNMLLYNKRLWYRMGSLSLFIKHYLLYLRQKKCFENANGIILLSEYADKQIKKRLNIKKIKTKIINHGIDQRFILDKKNKNIKDSSYSNTFSFLYVSTIYSYKNQIEVLKAIKILRSKEYPVSIIFVGNCIDKLYSKKFKKLLLKLNNDNIFKHYENISHQNIVEFYKKCDGIIFASSCENMPFILMESMGSGKPIASSNKGPMKEFLKNGGYYFNPENHNSIVDSLVKMLDDHKTWDLKKKKNQTEIKNYNWGKASKQTLDFLAEIKSDHDLRKSRNIN